MTQSNVGRQRVVDCWSSNRERVSSKLGMDALDGQQRSAGRVHRSGRRRDGQHVVKVCRRACIVYCCSPCPWPARVSSYAQHSALADLSTSSCLQAVFADI